jgi:nucleotide-binding universal stress UspA family protein
MPPLALCAVADDAHAGDVVATGHRLEVGGAFTARYVHVATHGAWATTYAPGSVAVASAPLTARPGPAVEHRALPFLAALGVPAESVDLATGDPVEELQRRAAAAALLVVGSRRRGPVASALVGSVSRALIVHARVPVLVATPAADLDDPDGPVLCGVSPLRSGSAAMVRGAAGLARRLDRPLLLVAVVDGLDERVLAGASSVAARATISEDIEGARALLEHLGAWLEVPRGVHSTVRVGAPASALAHVADAEGAALLVVGCRPSSVFGTLLGGSVSQEIIRETSRAVVVVPPHGWH